MNFKLNKKNIEKWEDCYYCKSIIFPLKQNLYPSCPGPKQYNITIPILEDYLKKKKAIEDRFDCGSDGFDGMAFKHCLYFGWIICIICAVALGSTVGGIYLGVGIVVALFFIARRFYNTKREKALSAIEIPMIEKYIEDYEQWRRDNNISAW
jgi:hypothetical protein